MGRLPLPCHQEMYLHNQLSPQSETEVRAEFPLLFSPGLVVMLECAGGNSAKAHCSAAGDAMTQQQAMLSIQPKEIEGTPPSTWSP